MHRGVRVSVYKREWSANYIRIPGTGILIVLICLALVAGPEWVMASCLALGIVLSILTVNETIAAIRNRARRCVIDTGTGFLWQGDRVEMQVEDGQVTAVRLTLIPRLSSRGNVQSVFRCFEVWIADRKQPLCMCNQLSKAENDPLGTLIARITDDLKRRAAASLSAGTALEGDGWRLSMADLRITGRGQSVTIALNEIEHAASCDGLFSIWRHGERGPAGGIRADSKNAPVLVAMLRELIDFHNANTNAAPVGNDSENEGLGQLLFARRHNDLAQALAVLSFIVATTSGVLLFTEDLRYYALLGWVLAAILYIVSHRIPVAVFGCYEHGFVQTKGGRERIIRYCNIVEFTYTISRIFGKHGEFLGVEFEVDAKTPDAAIRFHENRKRPDTDLEHLCREITEIVANNMQDQLRAGRPVPWLSDVTILPEGLQFHRTTSFGSSAGALEVLPYMRIGRVADDGIYGMVFDKDKPDVAVLKKSLRTSNFLPGFVLLQWLVESGV